MNENFLKTRVESLGLTRKLVESLLEQSIRTVGGIVSRSETELKRLLGDSNTEVILEKINAIEGSDRSMPTVSSVTTLHATYVNKRQAASLIVDGEDDIVETISEYFGYKKKDVVKHSRRQEIVKVRDLIVYLLREYGDMSYPAIGRLLGGRDHTTIIHAYKKIKANISARPEIEAEFVDIVGKVKEIKERKLRVEEELAGEIFASTEAERQGVFRPAAIKEIPERNMKILELYREGLTLENIGKVFAVTRERIRQVVAGTIKQIAVNESVSKGIVMDSDVIAQEESKKRRMAKDTKRARAHPSRRGLKEKRWSMYYAACRGCGTTTIPHVKHGFCEHCSGNYRGERRDTIIARHSNRCDVCGISRGDAVRKYGRDFYVTKSEEVLCRKHFLESSGKKMVLSRWNRKAIQ